jgi:sister-chromatid-cohesion protein PDS5
LECIATAENVSYLYATAGQLKMVKDRSVDDSRSLYIIAEMLVVMIRDYCVQQGWTLQTYSGKVGIPKELFQRLDDEAVAKNLKTVYYRDGENHKLFKQKRPVQAKVKREDQAKDSDSESEQAESKKVKLSTEPPRRSERSRKPLAIIQDDAAEN